LKSKLEQKTTRDNLEFTDCHERDTETEKETACDELGALLGACDDGRADTDDNTTSELCICDSQSMTRLNDGN
jgi:hypothetical protein